MPDWIKLKSQDLVKGLANTVFHGEVICIKLHVCTMHNKKKASELFNLHVTKLHVALNVHQLMPLKNVNMIGTTLNSQSLLGPSMVTKQKWSSQCKQIPYKVMISKAAAR